MKKFYQSSAALLLISLFAASPASAKSDYYYFELNSCLKNQMGDPELSAFNAERHIDVVGLCKCLASEQEKQALNGPNWDSMSLEQKNAEIRINRIQSVNICTAKFW